MVPETTPPKRSLPGIGHMSITDRLKLVQGISKNILRQVQTKDTDTDRNPLRRRIRPIQQLVARGRQSIQWDIPGPPRGHHQERGHRRTRRRRVGRTGVTERPTVHLPGAHVYHHSSPFSFSLIHPPSHPVGNMGGRRSAASLALTPAPMLEGYRVFFWAHLLPSQPIRLGQERRERSKVWQ